MDYSHNEYDSDGDIVDDILGPEDLFNDEDDGENARDENEGPIEGKTDEKESEAEEKPNKKPKTRRVVRSTRVTLNVDTLKGPNGLSALKKQFADFKFKGSGHEKEDLNKIVGLLQQWMCYQLCPMYDFESCILQLETLGKKKVVQTLMKKYRLGIDDWGEKKPDTEDLTENNMETSEVIHRDDFDLLFDKEISSAGSDHELNQNDPEAVVEKQIQFTLTADQLERIARNRKLAEERRSQRLSSQQTQMEINEESNRTDQISLENINLGENS